MTLTKILRDNGLAARATVHGFRSAFRDWCAETGAPREVAEAALAHTVGGVEGEYFRSDLFERRRALMESWGSFWPARHELRTLDPIVAASSISTPAATVSRMSGSGADHRRLLQAALGQGCGAPRGPGRTVR
ncbi:MAG: hypothetical protein OXP70_12020 [Acidobacteriota bacterium]|nr:hypothetical protein [Acidobacteriota bacterium]